jgi:Asp-tRNA(Asn)/Glu-tRNA(Gln) amidotransferase A subunit family amidase
MVQMPLTAAHARRARCPPFSYLPTGDATVVRRLRNAGARAHGIDVSHRGP